MATLVKGGHAENALPQRATANINCRIFPGVGIETVRAELEKAIGDPAIKVNTDPDATASDASPLRADVVAAVSSNPIWAAYSPMDWYRVAQETNNPVLFEAVAKDAEVNPLYKAWAYQNSGAIYAKANGATVRIQFRAIEA